MLALHLLSENCNDCSECKNVAFCGKGTLGGISYLAVAMWASDRQPFLKHYSVLYNHCLDLL